MSRLASKGDAKRDKKLACGSDGRFPIKIAVIGAGSWGTTLAMLSASSNPTALWARRSELANEIESGRQNPDYLPGVELPFGLRATSDLSEAIAGADALVVAVPSHGFRDVIGAVAGEISDHTPILSLTKGLEQGSLERMTQVAAELLPGHDASRIGVLTGPNLASEIAAGQPSASVIAMEDHETAVELQHALATPTFRIYTHTDVLGAEIAGAAKNVMAIAAGMARGLGFGHNSMAALVTRALAEITRLGVAMGGRPETFAGLAGLGDLVATCASDQSRNHRVGVALAKGQAIDEIVSEMRMVAEGVKTTVSLLELAKLHEVDMPIAAGVGRVLHEGEHPRDAVLRLMSREAKPENH